jgi:putative transposase
MVHGYYLFADAERIHVSGGGAGLVQPLCTFLADVEYLDSRFCLEALEAALRRAKPQIFNTDQGAQFTCREFTGRLEQAEIHISMDGRGRALDNVFVERLWRSLKYEEIYIWNHETVPALKAGVDRYFRFYNTERPHQSLNNKSPLFVYENGGDIEPGKNMRHLMRG